MNILLGVTGSVAATLAPKMVASLEKLGNVGVVITESAKPFLESGFVCLKTHKDSDEWNWNHRDKYQKDDPVLHIDLREWADVFVIAPLTMNTLAKMANGICDNLLTSVFRAWDWTKPVVIAPSANTKMYKSPFTEKHLLELKANFPIEIVYPICKKLACGEDGVGAMANIDDIVAKVEEVLPIFPLESCNGIPVGKHPGSFGVFRHKHYHGGVDLYTNEGEPVMAIESGCIIKVEQFTGKDVGSDWWNKTSVVVVRGKYHDFAYGEVNPCVQYYDDIKKGDVVGYVTPVIKEGKERPDVPGHSRSMLHLEMYERCKENISYDWSEKDKQPDGLLDPTNFLLRFNKNNLEIK